MWGHERVLASFHKSTATACRTQRGWILWLLMHKTGAINCSCSPNGVTSDKSAVNSPQLYGICKPSALYVASNIVFSFHGFSANASSSYARKRCPIFHYKDSRWMVLIRNPTRRICAARGMLIGGPCSGLVWNNTWWFLYYWTVEYLMPGACAIDSNSEQMGDVMNDRRGLCVCVFFSSSSTQL